MGESYFAKKSADSQLVEYLSVADSVWKTN